MKTTSTNITPAGSTSTKQTDRVRRLHFNDPKERGAHIQAFLEWLPPILKTALGICWEQLPSMVMSYLIRAADMPEAIAITLAVGSAMDAMKPKILYTYCVAVTNLFRRLRRNYGMVTLADLSERRIWDAFVAGRLISSGDLNMLKRYETLAGVYQRPYFEELPERQQVIWKPYLLPKLSRGFCEKQAQQQAVIAATQARRKEKSDIIVPLFPLIVELVQLCKQAAERLVKEFRKVCARAAQGEITLPYRFEYVDRQFSISEQAMTLSEVQLIEQPVTLILTLWNRTELVKHHPQLYTKEVRLKEIAEMLQDAHGGRIPIVHPEAFGNKAADLVAEPYFFQWAASPDGLLGHFNMQDVASLLRFLFHGLTLTTRVGEPIRIAPHLLRHVLATHARTALNIPAEAIAYLLHHRVRLEGTSAALTIPEATAYYSRLPVAQLLALLFEIQPQLAHDQGRSYLQAPSPQTLEHMDVALRKQFERCGMIGPTVLGFCSAGTCVRPDNRGICANCRYLVPHYSNLSKAKTWQKLYVLQAKLHDDQGHTIDAEQARRMVQYIDDAIRIMEIQVRTRQDGGYLPFADTLPPVQDEEGDTL